jgi:tetratricopeptide (TPR) repeat protein
LEGTGLGAAPIPAGWIRFLAVLPWLVLAGLWWRWAQQRAVLTDPERSRKEALLSWKTAVQLLRGGAESAEMREKSLLVWQKSVAGTLGVDAATPAWPEISAAAPTLQENDRADLEKCWLESDDALYGRNPSLNGDWCERATLIANRIDLPRLKVWEPLRPRNLLPWFGVLLILALTLPTVAEESAAPAPPAQAEDPIRLYREGSFEKAGQIWGQAVRNDRTDPVSRNNLGLAWFQIGDKERALANGLSAYLVSPQTATVDWNMMIFADAADQLDPAIRRLLEETWSSWLTSKAGVFTWQLWLVVGSTVAALGVGLWLASGYFAWKRKLFFRLGSGVVFLGAALAFVAGSALGVYGKLSDRAAVMVVDMVPLRSVPTEVETQAEKAYPPGSIAHREKEFLGWSKVRMPNNDAGWIRTENLVPLY